MWKAACGLTVGIILNCMLADVYQDKLRTTAIVEQRIEPNWVRLPFTCGFKIDRGTDATNGDQEALEEMWEAVPPRWTTLT